MDELSLLDTHFVASVSNSLRCHVLEVALLFNLLDEVEQLLEVEGGGNLVIVAWNHDDINVLHSTATVRRFCVVINAAAATAAAAGMATASMAAAAGIIVVAIIIAAAAAATAAASMAAAAAAAAAGMAAGIIVVAIIIAAGIIVVAIDTALSHSIQQTIFGLGVIRLRMKWGEVGAG
jgi:hypothetical protein